MSGLNGIVSQFFGTIPSTTTITEENLVTVLEMMKGEEKNEREEVIENLWHACRKFHRRLKST